MQIIRGADVVSASNNSVGEDNTMSEGAVGNKGRILAFKFLLEFEDM